MVSILDELESVNGLGVSIPDEGIDGAMLLLVTAERTLIASIKSSERSLAMVQELKRQIGRRDT